MNKKEIADRIFALLDQTDMEQQEFARLVNVSDDTASNWRRYKSASFTKRLPEIAAILNTTEEYLLTGKGTVPPLSVPVLGDVAAGIPIAAIQDIVDYEELDQAMAGSGEYFGLRLKGDSMEPRMREGDVVIVRKQDDAETGDTVVVLVNGDSATVKKLKKGPSGITLIPNNPVHDPMFYSNDEIAQLPVRILGKVVELRAKF